MTHRYSRNVGEQNAATLVEIRQATATLHTGAGLPPAVLGCLHARGVHIDRCVAVELAWVPYEDVPYFSALLLTPDARFLAVRIAVALNRSTVEAIEQWEDVTEVQNLSPHNRGTGKSRSLLALEVYRELNRPSPPFGVT